MDIALLQILLRRSHDLGMTQGQIRTACWKHGQHKHLDQLSDEQATELAGKMKVLLAAKEKVSLPKPTGKVRENGEPVELLLNPMTGVEIDINDPDQLIEASLQASYLLPKLRDFERLLREHALKLAKGEGRVRRLRGEKRSAVLENCGGVHPDMETLRFAFESFPQWRNQFMRADQVALKLKQFNQLSDLETDDPLYKDFTELLRRAVAKGSPVLPVLKLDNE